MRILRSILCTALIAGAASAAGAPEPGTDRLIFPHDLHVAQDLDCLACHGKAAASVAAGERLLPDMDVCAECHDVADEAACTRCHTAPDLAGESAPRAFGADFFSHARHLQQGAACADCHGDAVAAAPRIPGKPDCRRCHATAEAFLDCGTCHREPERPLPADHRGDWLTGHALPAQGETGRCYQCHTETGCQECHAGDNVRPRSHGPNFVFGHAIEARGNELECVVCHSEPLYCSSCHQAQRVMPRSHSSVGWVNAGDGGRHALDAPFELESCIACHDTGAAAPTCAACHGG